MKFLQLAGFNVAKNVLTLYEEQFRNRCVAIFGAWEIFAYRVFSSISCKLTGCIHGIVFTTKVKSNNMVPFLRFWSHKTNIIFLWSRKGFLLETPCFWLFLLTKVCFQGIREFTAINAYLFSFFILLCFKSVFWKWNRAYIGIGDTLK